MAWRTRAQSSTVLVKGPGVSMDQHMGKTPCRLTRPKVGLSPTTPHMAAGNRTEPPVSSPIVAAHREAAAAMPEPLLDMPGLRLRSQGFLGVPKTYSRVSPKANSVMFNFPRSIAPACLSRRTTVASSSGTWSE